MATIILGGLDSAYDLMSPNRNRQGTIDPSALMRNDLLNNHDRTSSAIRGTPFERTFGVREVNGIFLPMTRDVSLAGSIISVAQTEICTPQLNRIYSAERTTSILLTP